MSTPSRIYVAGHRGMVGSAIVRQLLAHGHPVDSIVTRTHAELDLTDQAAVRTFFAAEKPDQVYLAAAKVGGIHANNTYPAEFIYQNLMMQANVIDAAFRHGVQRLLFLGSSCIYPKLAPQPMREDALLTGTLEPSQGSGLTQENEDFWALRDINFHVKEGERLYCHCARSHCFLVRTTLHLP